VRSAARSLFIYLYAKWRRTTVAQKKSGSAGDKLLCCKVNFSTLTNTENEASSCSPTQQPILSCASLPPGGGFSYVP